MLNTNLSRLLALCILICNAVAQAELPTPQQLDNDAFNGLYQVGDMYLSGQPSEAGLAWAKQQGVAKVINLRTDDEMADAYDEAKASADLNLDYASIPLGGPDNPFTPAAVASLAKELEGVDGKVLLHCKTAGRASHLWAAYLVRYKGLTVPEAVAYTQQINFGTLPLQGLLGQPLVIDVKSSQE